MHMSLATQVNRMRRIRRRCWALLAFSRLLWERCSCVKPTRKIRARTVALAPRMCPPEHYARTPQSGQSAKTLYRPSERSASSRSKEYLVVHESTETALADAIEYMWTSPPRIGVCRAIVRSGCRRSSCRRFLSGCAARRSLLSFG